MKILVVGGGSGGHVTPAIAVVQEVLKEKPKTEVRFWTDKKYYKNVVKITTLQNVKMRVKKIPAGKFRRYTHIRAYEYLLPENWRILGQNGVDFFRVGWAIFVSICRMIIWRPNVVFLKGGYVSLPVGVAARVLSVPYVIHDSDAQLGLTSRLLVKKAAKVALGMPPSDSVKEDQKYIWTGIPVNEEFHKIGEAEKRRFMRELELDPDKPLVLATGGSQGSMHLNDAVGTILPDLLKVSSVVLIAGRNKYQDSISLKDYEVWEKGKMKSDFRLFEFSTEMPKLLGAADVIISRAGATTIAEIAAMRKAMVLIPYGVLPGKHQSKNADMLAKAGAAKVIEDEDMMKDPLKLLKEVKYLVKNKDARDEMAKKLYETARPDAAKELARVVLEVAK